MKPYYQQGGQTIYHGRARIKEKLASWSAKTKPEDYPEIGAEIGTVTFPMKI